MVSARAVNAVRLEEVLRRAMAGQRDGVDADATALDAVHDHVGDHRVADAHLARAGLDVQIGEHAEALPGAQCLDDDGARSPARRRRWCRRRRTRRHGRAARRTTSSRGSGSASRSSPERPALHRAELGAQSPCQLDDPRDVVGAGRPASLHVSRAARSCPGSCCEPGGPPRSAAPLERVVVEPLESLDHLRGGELVVVGDGQRIDGRHVGCGTAVGCGRRR